MPNPTAAWCELIHTVQIPPDSPRAAIRSASAWHEIHSRLRSYARIVSSQLPALTPEDLEDLVQSLLVRLQERALQDRVAQVGAPSGFLVVSLRHLAIDLLRHRTAERESMDRLAIDLLLSQAVSSADDRVLWRARLREAMKRLSESDRELLHSRFWRGLSFREIATERNERYSAVSVRAFRLIRRLRTELEADRGPAGSR